MMDMGGVPLHKSNKALAKKVKKRTLDEYSDDPC